MEFMLLIHEPRGQRALRTETEGRDAYAQMVAFSQELERRGMLRAVQSLATDAAGVRVQVRAGRTQAVDGPFIEAKEIVGGFFLIDVATREQALAIAAECPAAGWATVEVRPAAPCYE